MKISNQPVLGILSIILVVAVAMGIISLFEEPVFGSWVAFLFMACVPTQIICGLVWQCGYPEFTKTMSQPLKGLTFLLITILGGAICGSLMLYVLGGGTTPSPQLIMYTIFTIAITFWLVGVWKVWPLTALFKHPLAIGIGTLLLCYLGGYLLFNLLFDFTFLEGAPVYVESLDPKGAFSAWQVMSFCVTSVAVIMFCILCDFWPLSGNKLANSSPVISGLMTSAWVLLVSGAVFYVATRVLKIDYVVYMVRGPVSFIFGAFIVLNLFQNSLFSGISKQPVRGLVLAIICVVFAAAVQFLYELLGPIVSGPLNTGSPTYQLEIWIANAMLAVSFPLIVLFTDFLQMWPLVKSESVKPAKE